MSQEYPVTRLQAAKWLRTGTLLIELPSSSGDTTKIRMHHSAKKIVVTVAYGNRIHLNWKQALGLLRRNYVRSYMETV
jgi:hypothetical protein